MSINNFKLSKVMKKNFRFALMSAIALVGAATFTACSSSDDVADVNPTYDGTSVRTDFAFNITKASQSQTRMTATNVQEPTGFRGMQNMYLFAMQGVPGESGTTHRQTYALQTLAANLLDDKDETTTPSSKVYPLTIPVGTDNFLFYARALLNSETNFQVGKVEFNNLETTTTTPTDITFSLVPIEKPSGVATERTDVVTLFQNYLNSIAEAKVDNDKTWAKTVDKSATDSRYSGIAKLYTDFAKPVAGEVRSGSSESIMRTIRDLYTSMKRIIELSDGTDAVSKEIKDIATAACTAMAASIFNFTEPSSSLEGKTAPYGIAWKDGVPESAKTFPASYDLPMGAAQLIWDVNATEKNIKYNTNFDYSPQTATSSLGVDVTKIAYPAEILYYDNSPLRATDQYKKVADYPITTTLWDADAGTIGGFDGSWTGTSVQPSTRAVAMKNNVNYGVALLESTVKLKSGVTTLNDNRNAIVAGSGNQSFTVSDLADGKGFQLTGILIGGQPGSVNWKLLPSDALYDYAIYDKDLDGTGNWEINGTTTGSELTKLYTVCFDNFVSGAAQKEVCIALEFKNNMDVDFYGAKNMIPAGNTFYLVGKLQVTANSSSPGTWDSVYPAGYRVSESATPRVFGQDHKTVVTFSLNENSLKAAYSTIPDLRSTEMLFGLSVDLHWKAGLTFDIELQ